MRLAYVTAHYPPDFTSGATLQVMRLARQAASIGHDVEVFSGAIAMDLGDGERRTDTIDGITVRWIGTTDRVEQGDDGNWDNPLAAAASAAWLREFEPDVVHVHTLQTLGVGVLEAAADAGRVVVTMHDLWWWCSRLFLVDTELRPCPLVTDVGTCACARTAAWRTARAERLGRALDRVDRILTPSAALRDVVVANGVDPRRVTVDENDIAIEHGFGITPTERRTSDAGHVRFLYLGGDSALKGADVVRDAAHLLADRSDWTLSTYGMSAPDRLPDQVTAAPPFDPSDLGAVLLDHDVLLIPSIARESFSIAAREALVAGLPVITSDCLGPEEVVHDGENGFVVTTGSAAELAAAMASLIDEPGRLDELRRGIAEAPVTIRDPSRHVDDLIELYDATEPTAPRRQWNVAFVVGADGAIARYRVHHPSESLRLHGATTRIAHYLDPTLDRIADGMDAVVLQRVPATARVLDLVEQWRSAGLIVVFDVDDLIVDPAMVERIPGLGALAPEDRERYVDGLHRYRTTLEHCDGAIVPTAPLAESIGRTTGLPVAVVPNGLGLEELRLAVAATSAPRRSDHALTTLAYFSGSDSHQADLDLISPSIADVMRERREVRLLLVGPITPGPALASLGDRITHRDFQRWTSLYEQLAAIDVNLAPLVLPSEFNEAKSAIKWLEAAAVGVPTVASATRPFLDAIDDDRTGVLCAAVDDWSASLTALVDDPRRRQRLGRAARRRAELAHGPHLTGFAYRAALGDLAERRVAGRVTDWVDRAPDERAPSAPPLDPYRLAGDGRRVRRRWWTRRRR